MRDLGAVTLTTHRQREGDITVSLRRFTNLVGEIYCFVAEVVDERGQCVCLTKEEREALVHQAKAGLGVIGG